MNFVQKFSVGVCLLGLTACGGGIEIEGTFTDDFGQTFEIDADQFRSTSGTMTSTGAVIEFDNAANRAIVQNAADAAFGPNQFNVIDWTEPTDAGFSFCTTDFGLETLMAAQSSTKTADATNLMTGCGGFSWSRMTPVADQ